MQHIRIGTPARCAAMALAALLCLTACQAAASPLDTLAQMESAYNRLDMDALLACFEPVQAKAMRSAVNVLAGLGGVSGDDLLGMLPLFANLTVGTGQGGKAVGVMPKIALVAKNLRVNGDSAACDVTITLTAAGQTQRAEGSCTFIRQDGRWYIQNLR